MSAISENFSDLLDPNFRKIFFNKYGAVPEEFNSVFSMETSKKAEEKYSQIGGFQDLPEFNGTLAYQDITQGYDTTLTPQEFAGAFAVKRRLFDTDQYKIMNRAPAGLGLAAGRTREKHKANIFNNSFDANPSYQSGNDGKYLCDTAHPSKSVSSTQDNEGTTALSATSLEATRILMRDFRDAENNHIPMRADTLVVPANLEKEAWEITNSKFSVSDAHNTDNFFKGKYKVIVGTELTDANNWWLLDSERTKECLIFVNSIPMEFKNDTVFNTFEARYSAYGVWGLGWIDWRCLFGNQVS